MGMKRDGVSAGRPWICAVGVGLLIALSLSAGVHPALATKKPEKLTVTKTPAKTETKLTPKFTAKPAAKTATKTPGKAQGGSNKLAVDKDVKKLLEHINAERKDAGAGPLKFNPTLQAAAKIRGEEAVESFSHTRPDGSMYYTVFEEVGQTEQYYSAENLSAGRSDPAQVCDGWMNSKGHKANMLNPTYTEAGIYHAVTDDPNCKFEDYWVIVLQGEA